MHKKSSDISQLFLFACIFYVSMYDQGKG
ncbi:sortase B protein-sorting domain-containing protein [Paenibacillus sp. NPDC093718]